MSATLPVLIVGAGPTGLMLANLLAHYEVPFRLIEQKTRPIQTSNALMVQPRSLEMWNSIGIAEEAIARGKKIQGLTLNNANGVLGKISVQHLHLATLYPFMLGLPQAESEILLSENLLKNKGEIERGVIFTRLNLQQTSPLLVDVKKMNEEEEQIACQWLIACDGAHSSVRKALKLKFSGETLPEKFMMMDAVIEADFDPHYVHTFSSHKGPIVFIPMPHCTRIICMVTHDSGIQNPESPTLADFEYAMATRIRLLIQIRQPLWISHFVTHHRLIDQYCHQSVIFAGDSAHIHSPVGGQGMNTGMQDVFNLAWKLALIFKKKASLSLMNTYEMERYPVAKKVLAATTWMTHLIGLRNPIAIFCRDYGLRFLLKFSAVQNKIIQNVSELGLSYQPNAIILPSMTPNRKIKAGQRALDVILEDSKSHFFHLYDVLTVSKYSLLIFYGEKISITRQQQIHQLTEWIKQEHGDWFSLIIVARDLNLHDVAYFDKEGKAHHCYDVIEGGFFIIRPDQYIGLCSTEFDIGIVQRFSQKLLS